MISARKGEFETGFDRGGQTREHAMLVKTAGVRHMIVLVNKMDDPTVNWDEERFVDRFCSLFNAKKKVIKRILRFALRVVRSASY